MVWFVAAFYAFIYLRIYGSSEPFKKCSVSVRFYSFTDSVALTHSFKSILIIHFSSGIKLTSG